MPDFSIVSLLNERGIRVKNHLCQLTQSATAARNGLQIRAAVAIANFFQKGGFRWLDRAIAGFGVRAERCGHIRSYMKIQIGAGVKGLTCTYST